MKLAIVTPTYQRTDNTTPYYLSRLITALKSQTHTDFKFYLIGDKYENNSEFESFSNLLAGIDYHMENLPVAKERDKYPANTRQLWCCGGVNAYNHGIELALNDGYDWICHLDHDDYWDSDHLSVINTAIETIKNVAVVYTCAEYTYDRHIPPVPLDNEYVFQLPVACNTIHSAVCINHRAIPLRLRDVYEAPDQENIYNDEADADMWNRVSEYLTLNQNLQSVLCRKVTCHHVEESALRAHV